MAMPPSNRRPRRRRGHDRQAPSRSAQSPTGGVARSDADQAATVDDRKARSGAAKPEKKVDLNNATLAELKTLPTVGDAEAKKIIANRPYISKTDLVTKAGLPEGVYLAVRDKVVVNDMKKPRHKKPAPKK